MLRGLVVSVAFAVVAGSAVSLPAAVGAETTAERILLGGIGDGGPATDALVNATDLHRETDGDLLVREGTTWRRIDGTTGLITRDEVPPLPPREIIGNGGITRSWLTDRGVAYLVQTYEDAWVVLVHADGRATELFRGPRDNGTQRSDWRVLSVGRDGVILLGRNIAGNEETPGTRSTKLLLPDGTFETLLDRYSTRGAVAPDGTIFVLTADGSGQSVIERISPDRRRAVVAGPDVAPEWPVVHFDVTPGGDKVLWAQGTSDAGYAVMALAVGGTVRTIVDRHRVGPAKTVEGACAIDTPLTAVLAEDDAALVACGSVRSFTWDGSQSDGAGDVVAGVNDRAWTSADSPSGTPLSRAFLGRILDSAESPDGVITLATQHGVYALAGAGDNARLVRLLAEQHPSQRAKDPAADIAYGSDGSLYDFSRIPDSPSSSTWRLQVLEPCEGPAVCGPARTIAGGGTATIGEGVLATEVLLGPGRILPAGGNSLLLSQQGGVFELDLVSGTFRRVAGLAAGAGPTTALVDDRPAMDAPLRPVKWLGRAGNGDLLIGHAGLHRMDDDGHLRVASGLDGESYAIGPEGAIFAALETEPRIWRQRPTGSYDVAAGVGLDLNPIGVSTSRPRVSGMSGGRLLVTDDASPSSRVYVVDPGAPEFSGDAPRLDVTAAHDGTSGKITVSITTPAGDPWHFRVRVWPGRSGVSPNRGSMLYHQDTPGGETWARYFTRYSTSSGAGAGFSGPPLLEAGQRLYIAMFAWQGDGDSAPPADVVEVTVPSPPAPPTPSPTPTPTATPVTTPSPAPAVLTAAVTPNVAVGRPATVTGRLTQESDGTGIASEPIRLESRRAGTSAWASVTTVTTAPDGALLATHVPTRNTEYRWVHVGTARAAAATSPAVRSVVIPTLSISAPTRTKEGKSVVVSGAMNPSAAGTAVTLEQKVGTSWKPIKATKTNAQGKYSFSVKHKKAGTAQYRVRKASTADLGGARSKTATVKVAK